MFFTASYCDPESSIQNGWRPTDFMLTGNPFLWRSTNVSTLPKVRWDLVSDSSLAQLNSNSEIINSVGFLFTESSVYTRLSMPVTSVKPNSNNSIKSFCAVVTFCLVMWSRFSTYSQESEAIAPCLIASIKPLIFLSWYSCHERHWRLGLRSHPFPAQHQPHMLSRLQAACFWLSLCPGDLLTTWCSYKVAASI